MGIIKKVRKNNKKPVKSTKYDENFKVEPLKLLVIIVNRHQGDYYLDMLIKKNNISLAFLLNGHGTATREVYDILNISENKKDIIISIIREDKIEDIFNQIQTRFNVSKSAKGIAFSCKIDSCFGVLAYRFLANIKENIKKE